MSRPNKNSRSRSRSNGSFFVCGVLLACFAFSSCTQIQMPKTEPFYAEAIPPKAQEFRWSNGKLPKSFDPARAASAPETDIVRAAFEGLTEIDAKTLAEIPAAAEKWSSTPDFRVWTFELRKDAQWSNGKRVTADDFVTSWKRLVDLGDKTAHRNLFHNIVGMNDAKSGTESPGADSVDFGRPPAAAEPHQKIDLLNSNSALRVQLPHAPDTSPSTQPEPGQPERPKTPPKTAVAKFGVEAIGDTTLQVTLEMPDKDFPKLVANPIFRPIYGDGKEFESDPLDDDLVTNGAFEVASVGKDGIMLDRSETYWDRSRVKLEHVRFVPQNTAEAGLDAYKNGDIDALTNVDFEPLALKLLAPYEDFRQTTHSAINFYEINTKNAPFSDRRVREALAISIDRERLTDREMEGSAQPATSFLPLGTMAHNKLVLDVDRAKKMLDIAGFANGVGFPKIRLLVNRNDIQQRVARTVARMWKLNLNVETEIIVKDAAELEVARTAGDFDLVRRGAVLPTVDESVNLATILGYRKKIGEALPTPPATDRAKPELPISTPTPTTTDETRSDGGPSASNAELPIEKPVRAPMTESVITETDAMYDLYAIPLYFPTSYSLVKPFVIGFETNGLDAPLLKDISIDSGWKPKPVRGEQ
ncbi:ABC transporter substrate-binding protein [soil metagenome]